MKIHSPLHLTPDATTKKKVLSVIAANPVCKIFYLVLLIVSQPVMAQITLNTLPSCVTAESLVDGELRISSNTVFAVCPEVRTLAISQLVMEQGAILQLPSDADRFDLVVDRGVFAHRTEIVAHRRTVGEAGAALTVTVNRANFDFSETVDHGLQLPLGTDEAIYAALLDRRINQGLHVPEDVKFRIVSSGAIGRVGAQGESGFAAQRKSCIGSSGHAAGDGKQGESGGSGGNGGSIHAEIKLIPFHPPISNTDIELISHPGVGGPGGVGGVGGRGALGSVCGGGLYSRSAWPDGSQGPAGQQGPSGNLSEVKLDLQFAD
jgi:hypothetical protein